MEINREDFLSTLQLVQAGLADKENLEQSTCFVFSDKQVITFNDEIACRLPLSDSYKKINGAVRAKPLMAILSKLEDDLVDLEASSSELVIKAGKGRRSSGISMESEVYLQTDGVEIPKKWKKLPETFGDSCELVLRCCGSDESEFALTCVHMTPKFVEATDRFQIARYTIDLPIKKGILVRSKSLNQVLQAGVTAISETESWLHFKNSDGLIISVRRSIDDFPDLSSYYKVEGEGIKLPEGISAAAEKASIFSMENAEDDRVIVQVLPKKVRIEGRSAVGWYRETKQVTYKGPKLKFSISPLLLTELIKIMTDDCQITSSRLKINAGAFEYVTCLGAVD